MVAETRSGRKSVFKCYLSHGSFAETDVEDLHAIVEQLTAARADLYHLPLPVIINLLIKLGKHIVADGGGFQKEGISYISLWLRRQNLEEICRINYTNLDVADRYVEIKPHVRMMAQPRGIVCHWIAANIPSLSIFSLVLGFLSKNASLVKVPPENVELVRWILETLQRISVTWNGTEYSGNILVNAIALVSFPGKDITLSSTFSLLADCRIIYGGGEAIASIVRLPARETCETIIYGPKYSFGIFDREFIEGSDMEQAVARCVLDVVTFNQMACSSPHVYFFERSKKSLREIGEMFAAAFARVSDALLHQGTPIPIIADIINKRAYYLLSHEQDAIFPPHAGWTILLDRGASLEDPVFGKTVFLKEVESLDSVAGCVTRKVQAITLCIADEEKRRSYAKQLAYKGADRIVLPGTSNEYDQPWDGILSLSRMVRWTILKENKL